MGWEQWCGEPPEHAPLQYTQPGYWGLLACPHEYRFAARLADLGVRQDSEIIVYADGPRSKGRDGRIAWMLLYLGAKYVSLLDGGWREWCKNGFLIESRISVDEEGSFQINLCEERRILVDELATRVGARADAAATSTGAGSNTTADTRAGLTLWDARTQREYDGEVYSYLPRMGRIPGSALFTYDTIYQSGSSKFVEEGQFLQLLENMPERGNNLKVASKRVAYCELGLRAATIAFLHELYTGEVVSIFDGGYMQWSLETRLPVAQTK
jgi:thiosulfate/3-mercaptopyruvate sulfurtransferase